MSIAILFGMVVLFMLIGVPIAMSLGLSSILFLFMFSHDASLVSVAQTLFDAFEGHYTLLAIPFFILASVFMSTGGVARRIIRFAIALVGSFRGGLAIASVFACMLFAALSGSSPATVVAIGSIVIAGMTQVGYSKEFAAGVICNAGTLGILIPPSIVMVVYAAATDVSVGRLFLAGVFPGLLAGGMLMLAIYLWARFKGLPSNPWTGWGEVLQSARDATWGLMLVIIILGGIYGGVFTPTEAAAVAAVYAFLIANFVYRDMGPVRGGWGSPALIPYRIVSVLWHKDTKHALFEAGRLTIMLMFIIANALLLKHVLTEERVPQMITEAMLQAGFGPVMFLVMVNVLLLIGGQFMEPSGLLIIVAPLVFPIAIALGIDPIHLGVIMVVNMEIGMITPPVGLNLFVTAGVAQMSIGRVIKAAMPWVAIMFLFLIIVTYVPIVSTWLPTTLMGPEIIIK
ncbi:MAG: TRAP transporter large permease [Chromatiaceae bacterium]|nr:TRAP transporter large permease [Gammaproteobacteria bacterium]MCP5301330.1 TRAP transporter large permease [Chromatiaceae bacterium]MCP5421904.1 TRAP transporter large permease [Chromatiaceae bacterium]